MMRSRIILATLVLPILAGCATETVDKGPPKMGQTVERPHPAEDTMAANRANQMQQQASMPTTVVPGDQGVTPGAASDNSIFSPSANNENNTAATNTAASNQPAEPVSPATPQQQLPHSSPLSPAPSAAPIKDGG